MRRNLENIERNRNKEAFVTIILRKKVISILCRILSFFGFGYCFSVYTYKCSGVVLDKEKGLVLTCCHLFKKNDLDKKTQFFVIVFNEKKAYKAEILVANQKVDLVVLKLDDYDGGFVEEIILATRYSQVGEELFMWSDIHPRKGNEDEDEDNSYCDNKMRIIASECLGYLGCGKILVNSAKTLPGMSGSGVYNKKEKLVGIHIQKVRCGWTQQTLALAVSNFDIKSFLENNGITYKKEEQ